jgi:hypothetical protein
MWAGCRATHGVHSGRVAFEVHASYIWNLKFLISRFTLI